MMTGATAVAVALVFALLAFAPVAPAAPSLVDQTEASPASRLETQVKAIFTTLPGPSLVGWAEARGAFVLLQHEDLALAVFNLAGGVDARAFLAQLEARPDVEWASFDGLVHAQSHVRAPLVPNPPGDARYGSQYGPGLLGAEGAWAYERGSEGITVAILDTGVDATHPDLAKACRAGCGQGGFDAHGHGTHVAGIVAAEANNGVGIAGVAQVRLLAVKALSDLGVGTWSQLAIAIADASAQGAHVISMSIGGECNWNGDDLCRDVEAAVNLAWSRGAVLVASSGNDGGNRLSYPAAYGRVISVGAVDANRLRTGWSNGGPDLDLVAPGRSILSTVPAAASMCKFSDGYCTASGTSMAAAHASGVAALVWSHCPTLANADVVSILRASAEDLGTSGRDTAYGYGLVRADHAIAATPAC